MGRLMSFPAFLSRYGRKTSLLASFLGFSCMVRSTIGIVVESVAPGAPGWLRRLPPSSSVSGVIGVYLLCTNGREWLRATSIPGRCLGEDFFIFPAAEFEIMGTLPCTCRLATVWGLHFLIRADISASIPMVLHSTGESNSSQYQRNSRLCSLMC